MQVLEQKEIEIIEKLDFLKGVELDPWILSWVLAENGARRYSYEIACIIVNYTLLIHYINCRIKDSFIEKQIEYYRRSLEKCLEDAPELKIEILKKYAEKYRKNKK